MKEPPYSREAESSVLGAILLDNEALSLVSSIIETEDLYIELHRSIYRAMLDIYSKQQPIDITTVYLRTSAILGDVGGITFLDKLLGSVPTATNASFYAEIVRDKSILRKTIKITSTALDRAFGDVDVVQDFVEELEKEIFGLSRLNSRQAYFRIREIIPSQLRELEARHKNQKSLTGITTGFIDLDSTTAGLQNGDLIILAARPSMGKTALAVNMLLASALNGVSAGFLSLEMSKESLAARMLCSEASVDSSRLRTGKITDGEWSRVIDASGLLSAAPIFIDDTPALTPIQIASKARRMKAENGIEILFIDYLQLAKSQGKVFSREHEIREISGALKSIAKELSIPVVALSQLNRGVDSRANKRPLLSDLRESGAIEQDADLILFIYRDEVYNDDSSEKGTAEVIVAKHRNGAIGTVKLKWFGNYTRFENIVENVDPIEAHIPY